MEGICPEAIALLQDKQFTPDMTRVLRNMKAARQVEAVELMIASNTITVVHAEALLKATTYEQRTLTCRVWSVTGGPRLSSSSSSLRRK